jgi:hypothetical protein
LKLSLHGLVSLVLSLTAILYGLVSENIFLYSLGLALLLLFLRELKAFARVRRLLRTSLLRGGLIEVL